MTRFMHAAIVAILALAPLSTASAGSATSDIPDTSRPLLPDSILVNPPANWRLSSLRPEIRRWVHLVVSKVPRFPHEDLRLRDPRKWPKVMFIGGEMLWRNIEYREYDIFREVRSVNDVPPGSDYTLCYGKGDRGPAYTWSRSTLVERSWRGDGKQHPATYLYIYYASGELTEAMDTTDRRTSADLPTVWRRHSRATGRFWAVAT
jgi:hypothetical protein